MNVVREINKINDLELQLGSTSASWHDEYKDSAYIYVGGLHFDLTEGDVITIFSQFGEIMDINMPRDKETGKSKGFAFLMYEDQRSTVLAVDNLNGAKVIEKTLRVDHVKQYKQPKVKNEEGEWVDMEEQSLNARPAMLVDEGGESDSSSSSGASIDPEDPMYEYLVAKRKEEKAALKSKKSRKSKGKDKKKRRDDETPEQRQARKERKKEKKAKKGVSDGVKGVQDLLQSLGRSGDGPRHRSSRRDDDRTPRDRSRSPERDYERSPRRRRSLESDRRYRERD